MYTVRNILRRFGFPARSLISAILFLGLSLIGAIGAQAATLDRIRQAGAVTFGYSAEERPFSLMEGEGNSPIGYSIALCKVVAEAIKAELGLSELAVEWIPISLDDRFAMVEQGKVDMLCDSSSMTFDRRKKVSFSIPVYPGGIAALMRADAPAAFRDVLLGRPSSGPIWRASPAQIMTGKTFSIVKGTIGESWLSERLDHFQLSATVAPVDSYAAGVTQVLDRTSDVLFGERPILVDAAAASASPNDLIILDRMFTTTPVALALARNDDDFRLVVDRALSLFFPSPEFRDLYTKWFGAPDDAIVTFIRQSALHQ